MKSDMDTIVAPATAAINSGVAVIRISGPEALDKLLKHFIFSKPSNSFTPRYMYYGQIVDSEAVIDNVMAVYFKSPSSFTGEDVCEIHCHGNNLLVSRIVSLFVACDCRLAEPGEFSRRAFLNGKFDLVQAESIVNIISAQSDASLVNAMKHLNGFLSREILAIQNQVIDILSVIEAYLDFPDDEIDLSVTSFLRSKSDAVLNDLENLLSTYNSGRLLKDGLNVAILGKPNAGKSSLMNYFLRDDVSIVSAVPGTTRDIVKDYALIKGIPVRFYDTAGIRDHASDDIEKIGIEKAISCAAAADVVINLIDINCDYVDSILPISSDNVINVFNKIDLISDRGLFDDGSAFFVSAKTGEGLDLLVDEIFSRCSFASSLTGDSLLITDARHFDLLLSAKASLSAFVESFDLGSSCDLLSIDLRDCLSFLGDIVGSVSTDDILDRIFSRFCIGK